VANRDKRRHETLVVVIMPSPRRCPCGTDIPKGRQRGVLAVAPGMLRVSFSLWPPSCIRAMPFTRSPVAGHLAPTLHKVSKQSLTIPGLTSRLNGDPSGRLQKRGHRVLSVKTVNFPMEYEDHALTGVHREGIKGACGGPIVLGLVRVHESGWNPFGLSWAPD
jgi:hypothetical protein